MGRSYSLPTIKTLFGQATHCGYPGCSEPLVFEDPARGVRAVVAQIAHIRSGTRRGPRYDAGYPADLIDSPENLLLLCGRHHVPVDQNESVYTVEELSAWKAAQVAQGGGTPVDDSELMVMLRTLESTVAALFEALLISVKVEHAGGLAVGGTVATMPIQAVEQVSMPGQNPTKLVGVKVLNKGASDVDVTGAGFDIDVGRPAQPRLTLVGEWCQHSYPHRLMGRSTAYWFTDLAALQMNLLTLMQQERVVPLRLRPFAQLGDDTTEWGAWGDLVELPIFTVEQRAHLRSLQEDQD